MAGRVPATVNFFRRQVADLATNLFPERAFAGTFDEAGIFQPGFINRRIAGIRGAANRQFFDPTSPRFIGEGDGQFTLGGISGVRNIQQTDLDFLRLVNEGNAVGGLNISSPSDVLSAARQIALDRDPSRVGIINNLITGRGGAAISAGNISDVFTPNFTASFLDIATQGNAISRRRQRQLQQIRGASNIDPIAQGFLDQVLSQVDTSTGRVTGDLPRFSDLTGRAQIDGQGVDDLTALINDLTQRN